MNQSTRTKEELRTASDFVYYEYSMIIDMFQAFCNPQSYNCDDSIRNAILESFLIHARNIIEFMYNDKNSRKDDIAANDFTYKTKNWKEIRLPQSDFLNEQYKRAHKKLAHLTYYRQEDTGGWNLSKIKYEIDCCFKIFVENVSKDELGERWKDFDSKSKNDNTSEI